METTKREMPHSRLAILVTWNTVSQFLNSRSMLLDMTGIRRSDSSLKSTEDYPRIRGNIYLVAFAILAMPYKLGNVSDSCKIADKYLAMSRHIQKYKVMQGDVGFQ
jgi:hypothetical protein